MSMSIQQKSIIVCWTPSVRDHASTTVYTKRVLLKWMSALLVYVTLVDRAGAGKTALASIAAGGLVRQAPAGRLMCYRIRDTFTPRGADVFSPCAAMETLGRAVGASSRLEG